MSHHIGWHSAVQLRAWGFSQPVSDVYCGKLTNESARFLLHWIYEPSIVKFHAYSDLSVCLSMHLSVEQSELKLWDELSLLICPWVRCLHFSCTYIGRTFNRHTRKENTLMGDFCSKVVQRIGTNSHLGNSPIGASFYIKIRFYSGIKLFYTTPFI